jgi:hypothetical protein
VERSARLKITLFLCLTISAFLGGAATPVAAPAAGAPRPLTFANVRAYFADSLGFRPTEVQKRCVIFYEGEWVNAKIYNYCVIIIENSDEDLQVTFYITDDQEMNWVHEFLQSSFFTQIEAENLYRLLNREKHAAPSESAASGSTLATGNRATPRSSCSASHRCLKQDFFLSSKPPAL